MTVQIVDVIIRTGQSNSYGQNPGGPGRTLAAVRYWDVNLTISDCSAWHDLDDTHGADYELGATLNAAGLKVAILNISQSATSSLDWTSPDTTFTNAVAEFNQALPLLAAEYPAGTLFRYHHVRDQGEAEAQTALLATVQAWSDNTLSWHGVLEGLVGQKIRRIVVQTNSAITGKTNPGVLEAEQLFVAGDAAHLVDRNACTYEGDGVHLTTAGYQQLGVLIASAVIVNLAYGGVSAALRSKLVDHQNNVAPHTPDATVYYAAFVAGFEVAGNGYARKAVTNDATNYPAASGRAKQLNTEQQFVPATGGAWGLVDEIVEFDAPTDGTVRARQVLVNPQQVNDGDTLVIPPGGFRISFPAGGYPDSTAHSLMDLCWGGAAYSAPATVHGSYWAGNPQSGGAQAGSRASVSQAATWAPATAGQAATQLSIAITQQASGTYWAEHTAPSGGTLVRCGPVTGTPNTGAIGGGAIVTRIVDAA